MSRHLLIVDDNKSVRDSLRFLLERRGYTTVMAAGGTEAIALSEKDVFDGALVDVNMPGMSGLAVCRALRAQAQAQGRKIVVWMITGARTPELLKSAAEAGALAVLGKPFDFADLFQRFDEQFGPPPTPPEAEPPAPPPP